MDPVLAVTHERELRALARIARDCDALERLTRARVPAAVRLEAELGPALATFLVGALGDRPARDSGWLAA